MDKKQKEGMTWATVMVRNNLTVVECNKGYLSIYYVTGTDSMQSMWRIRDTFGDSPNLHKGIVVNVIKRFLSFCLFFPVPAVAAVDLCHGRRRRHTSAPFFRR